MPTGVGSSVGRIVAVGTTEQRRQVTFRCRVDTAFGAQPMRICAGLYGFGSVDTEKRNRATPDRLAVRSALLALGLSK